MAEATIGEDRVDKNTAPHVNGIASQAAKVWGTLTVGIVVATLIGVTITLARLNERIVWAVAISFLLVVFCFSVGIFGTANLRFRYLWLAVSTYKNLWRLLRR